MTYTPYPDTLRTMLCILIIFFLSEKSVFAQIKNPETGYITTHDGEEIYFKTIGKGEPVIILHGGPGWYSEFDYDGLKKLSENFRLIFFDQRGSGNSQVKINPDTIVLDNFLKDITTVINHFGYEQVNLLGISFGAVLSIKYAIENPEIITSISLLSPGGMNYTFRDSINETLNDRLNQDDLQDYQSITNNLLWKDSSAKIASEQYRIIFRAYMFDKTRLNSFEFHMDDYTAQSHKIVGNYLLEDMGEFDYYPELNKVDQKPVLIIRGDYDPVPVSYVEKFMTYIPDTEYLELKNIGHFPHYEANESTLQSITTFIQSNKQ